MYERYSKKYEKKITIIHPGEFYVSRNDELIGTLLGSCVAVCLHDTVRRVSGMNHFMLPGRISERDIFQDSSAKYGITAINELISHMERAGAPIRNLSAKVFGGGHVLSLEANSVTIPHDNVRLARVLLEHADIPIVASDVGENYTRKILMDVKSGRIYLKKSTRQDVIDFVDGREQTYAQRLGRPAGKAVAGR